MSAYQAAVARNNAIIANQQGDLEIAGGIRQAEMKSLEGAAKLAKVRAGMAARGVDISSGSAVDVQASERELNKLDAETALSNAQIRAYGYRTRATSAEAQGGLYDMQSGAFGAASGDARLGGYLSAGGTLLSRASSLPINWGGGGGGGSGFGTSGSAAP